MKKAVIPFLFFSLISSPVVSQDFNYFQYRVSEIVNDITLDPTIKNRAITDFIAQNPDNKEVILRLVRKLYPEYFFGIPSSNAAPKVANVTTVPASGGVGLAAIGVGAGLLAVLALSGGDKDKNDDNISLPPDDPEQPPLDGENRFITDEFNRSYALGLIGAQDIYLNENLTGAGVLVSVIDSGLDQAHEDLIDNIDFANTYSFANDNGDTIDFDSHGTHVAGIIASVKNDLPNSTHGIAFNSKIMGIQTIVSTADDGWWYDRFIDPITYKDVADSFVRSLDAGAFVINNSWGFTNTYITDFSNRQQVEDFLQADIMSSMDSLAQSNSIAVFSAGNSGYSEVGLMGGLPHFIPELEGHIVVVGSVNSSKEISSFSDRCGVAANWCLVAPGENIYSTLSNYFYGEGAYGYMSGTSMAAPFVSGSIALMKEKFPELTPSEILNILYDQADDLGEVGIDPIYGRGMLNLGRSISPQGMISFNMTDSVNGDKHSINNTRFVSNGIISLQNMNNIPVMVTDKYNRGFFVDGSKFNLGPSKYVANSFVERSEPISVFGSTSGFIGGNDALSFYNGAIADSEYIGRYNNSIFYKPYEAVLPSDSRGFRFDKVVNDVYQIQADLIMSDTGSSILKMKNKFMFNNMGLSFESGIFNEKGSILGGYGVGALSTANIESETNYLSLAGDFDFGNNSKFLVSASMGDTGFSGQSLIQQNSTINTQSYSFGYEKNQFLTSNDTLSFMVTKPLHVNSGSASVNIPVARGVADGNLQNNDIKRDNVDIDLSSNSDLQIGINYNIKYNDFSNFSVNSSYANESLTTNLSFNLRF